MREQRADASRSHRAAEEGHGSTAEQRRRYGAAAGSEPCLDDSNDRSGSMRVAQPRMMAMMERCEEMMAKKDKRASATGLQSTRKTSAEGKWAWRPDPRQAPGPRAPLRPPVRVWVPADKSSTN